MGPGCGWDIAVFQFVTQSFTLLVYAAFLIVPLGIICVVFFWSKRAVHSPNSIPGAATVLLSIMLIHLNSTVMYTWERNGAYENDWERQSRELNRFRKSIKMMNDKLQQAQEKGQPSQNAWGR